MNGAIGNIYLHSREELDGFLNAVELAKELYSKAEESGLKGINVHIEAKQYSNIFGVEIKGETE